MSRAGVAVLTLAWAVLAAPVSALPIDRTVTIQPISVCDDAGANCADGQGILDRTRAATAAVFGQAGIGIAYLPMRTYDDSTYSTTTINEAGATDESRRLLRTPGHQQNVNDQILNMYFVPKLEDATGQQTYYAFGFTNGNGIIVGNAPRLDTLAHEIGHNLGLAHTTLGAGPDTNLMTDGKIRTIPGSVQDIAGGTTDQLTASQVAQARSPLFSVGQLPFRALARQLTVPSITLPVRTITQTGFDVVSPAGYPGLNYVPGAPRWSYDTEAIAPRASLPQTTLTGIKIRFAPGTAVTLSDAYPDLAAEYLDYSASADAGQAFCNPDCRYTDNFVRGTRATLPDGTIEFTWSFTDPSQVLLIRDIHCQASIGCSGTDYAGTSGNEVPCARFPAACTPGTGQAPAFTPYDGYDEFLAYFIDPAGGPSPQPFSTQFLYADGLVSQGFFDANGLATTEQPSALFFQAGTQPVAEPGYVAPVPGAFEVEVAVPEPATIGLLAGLLVAALPRRRVSPGRVPRGTG